jgi:hypothetical protein
VQGFPYFRCPPQHGIFVRPEKLRPPSAGGLAAYLSGTGSGGALSGASSSRDARTAPRARPGGFPPPPRTSVLDETESEIERIVRGGGGRGANGARPAFDRPLAGPEGSLTARRATRDGTATAGGFSGGGSGGGDAPGWESSRPDRATAGAFGGGSAPGRAGSFGSDGRSAAAGASAAGNATGRDGTGFNAAGGGGNATGRDDSFGSEVYFDGGFGGGAGESGWLGDDTSEDALLAQAIAASQEEMQRASSGAYG